MRMLLEEGFKVVIHDTDEKALTNLLTELGDLVNEQQCYPICFDPCNQESVMKAIEKIQKDFHPVYILINNNGIPSRTTTLQTTMDEWKQSFEQNVDSAFLISKAILPGMKKRKWGRIVNTCSIAGKTGGFTTGISYSTTKGALQSFTYALARECAKDGITANGIAPAYLRTPTLEAYPKEMLKTLKNYIPVGRFLEADEYAHTVKFLISPLAGFVCGEIIDLNGGLLMS